MNFGIIAAGEGSRLSTEGVSLPKPLVEIDGQPMIGRLINIFENCGATKINVIVNEEMIAVRDYLKNLSSTMKTPMEIIVKSTPSSMHSFYELSETFRNQGRFIMTTVDTIFRESDFSRYVEAWKAASLDVDALMAVTTHIDDEKPLFVMTKGNGQVTAFLDEKVPGCRFVSGGIYGLSQNSLSVLERCINEGVSRMRNFQRALLTSNLLVESFDMGKILDVDHAEDITKANEFLRER